jgi:hypothetical protein
MGKQNLEIFPLAGAAVKALGGAAVKACGGKVAAGLGGAAVGAAVT